MRMKPTSFRRKKPICSRKPRAISLLRSLTLPAKTRRRRGEASARSERVFSDTVIESMAGILYLFDEHGQFLRWNRELEIVTDYSSEEIARMQPLQFFSESDQPLLLAKITEVFKEGKASVEAPLLAKSGRNTPYFFYRPPHCF